MTRHCHHCGEVYGPARQPGRSETCVRCQADLHVCLNCLFYDVKVAYQCRERRADPVAEKAVANYCEHFEFASRVWVPKDQSDARADAARKTLQSLLGD